MNCTVYMAPCIQV